jgi:hypothetical protein
MATQSYYAHVSPDGKTPLDWLKAAGYNYLNAGENLVIDRDTSKEAVTAWMNSPEHRENILRPQFTEIGVGVAKGKYDGLDTIFVVQEFGTPYPTHAVATAAPKPVKAAPVVTNAPKASTTPAAKPKPAAPALAIAQLPKPAIISDAAAIVKPAAKKPAIPTATTTEASTTAQAASTTATSTVTYSLAPEFFAPVVLSALKTPAQLADPQALDYTRPTLIHKISLYIQRVSMTVRSAL